MVAMADLAMGSYLRRARLESSRAALVRDAARPTDHATTMAAKETWAYARLATSKDVTATRNVELLMKL